MLRLALAWVHLLALGIGLGAVWTRASILASPPDVNAIRRALVADTWWGIAAVVWITTGLWRLIAGTEKDIGYYMSNHMFFTKMGLLALILLLELRPMFTLIKWRRELGGRSDGEPATWQRTAKMISTVSYIQCVLVILMVLTAVAMARGFGAR